MNLKRKLNLFAVDKSDLWITFAGEHTTRTLRLDRIANCGKKKSHSKG